jgi:hypothetical protein
VVVVQLELHRAGTGILTVQSFDDLKDIIKRVEATIGIGDVSGPVVEHVSRFGSRVARLVRSAAR